MGGWDGRGGRDGWREGWMDGFYDQFTSMVIFGAEMLINKIS